MIELLEHEMIELLEHAGSDNSIANTARVSMGTGQLWNELPKDYTEVSRDRLIKYLAFNKHTSPFRHTSITVRAKVPIFLARQLGKHQVGLSWNEVSRRYVDTDIEFFYPEKWRKRPDKSIKQGSGETFVGHLNDGIQAEYDQTIQFAMDTFNGMLDAGVAPEMARMVLPQSMMTEFIWTGSLMAFAHVYNLRFDSHAQVEAQDFAKDLDKIIRPLFPVAWAALTGETNEQSKDADAS